MNAKPPASRINGFRTFNAIVHSYPNKEYLLYPKPLQTSTPYLLAILQPAVELICKVLIEHKIVKYYQHQ